MSQLGPHAAFILGSYMATLAILLALVAWIVLDNRGRKRELEALDARRAAGDRA